MENINTLNTINNGKKVCIVAEIGTGHCQNKDKSREIIRAAIDSGADLVKFQHFYADEILHPRTGNVRLPGGSIRLFERFKELELSPNFLAFLKTSCENLGGHFFCSPFGLRSASDLLELGENTFKIASPELNHFPLLRFLAPRAEHLVLSTGVSRLADIEEALDCIRSARVTLLHCITSYPAPESEYNLRLIPNLSAIFGLPVGLSDHSLNPYLVPSLSVLLGATMIEKHFTLDPEGSGLDDSVALTPDDFASMVEAVREAEQLMDSTEKMGSARGADLADHISRHSILSRPLYADDIALALGSGTKHLAPSEQANYETSRRSIHLLEDRVAGHTITDNDLAILRSEKNLRPGLHPRHLGQIIGCKLSRFLRGGDGIRWEDLLHRH